VNPAEFSLKHKTFIVCSIIFMLIGGLYAYFKLGKLEDPKFSVKTAVVVTRYPGASPGEVEQQVTDTIEKAVQQLGELDYIRSISRAGASIIFVDIKESCRADKLPQIWDELRRKIHDIQPQLPPGASPPEVRDDFGDVYGIFLALTGDGFSTAELKDYATILQRELLMVEDVARVELWGVQRECIYVDISRSRLSELRIRPEQIVATLRDQNMIIDPGSVDLGTQRIRLAPSGTFDTTAAIGDLVISGPESTDLVLLKDIADIRRGYLTPPLTLMRYNGKPGIGIAISTISGGNVIAMGDAVKKRLSQLMLDFPTGIDIGTISYQSETVRESVNTFIINLAESVAIVIGVLLLAMGLRSGLLIGGGLILSILGSFIVMMFMGIDLQRTSLGALIIAMGMLVDNAIVVTEGSLVRLQMGEDRLTAATAPATDTAWPLLAATLVAILAFIPIKLSNRAVGEYCESLFQVVGISLFISWILAMTATPVFCERFLRIKPSRQTSDPYAGRTFQLYKRLLEASLHRKTVVLLLIPVLLAASGYGLRYVKKIFFPQSTRAQFMVDYWLPEGSRIQSVSDDLKTAEAFLMKFPEVVSIGTCIGSGPPRFYLPYEPELINPAYGQMIVNVTSRESIGKIAPAVEQYVKAQFPQAEPRIRLYPLGPSTEFKIEARFSGPDPVLLRDLSEKAKAVMAENLHTKDVRDDWRQRVKLWVPEFSQPRARRAYVSRQHVAASLRQMTTGAPVGFYREDDELMPILVGTPEQEKKDLDNLSNTPVWGFGPKSLPLAQVVRNVTIEWEDPLIRRRNRRPTITAQCDPIGEITATEVLSEIRPKIEAIALPRGYTLEWGGEYEKSIQSKTSVYEKLPVALIPMILIVVALFNGIRQTLIIFLILPLSMIGITIGLLATRQPFGFMAMLGALSLIGMLIKNAVVLLDQIESEIRSGTEAYNAVVKSCVSRMRPVLMASVTTIFGMAPLLTDPMFSAMAVTIMSGLLFATLLTLILVPILYALFYNIDCNRSA